jgi:hypothetical protein
VHDEVAAIDAEGVDGIPHPARQTRPRVVELLGSVGEAQTREIERDRAQPLLRERGDHLPVQE